MKIPTNVRLPIAALSLSAAAFVGILTREGYTTQAVIPTKGDVPTVGFGTTNGVKMGDTTNPVKAVQRAMIDSSKYEGAVKRCIKVDMSQKEYDLYVDLAYNIGPTNFCTNPKTGLPSVIAIRLNSKDYSGACDAILLYKYAAGFDCSTPGNKRCSGLWTDRQRVYKQCMEAQ